MKVWNTINQFRDDNPVNQNYINNLLFETLKDYVFLYQDTESAKNLENIHSFDSHNHYEFVFSLFPCMKESGKWDTGTQFKPDLKSILLKFKAFNIPTETKHTKSTFKLFFLSRFCYYINVALLEHAEQLPKKDTSFDGLGKELPNMTGIFLRNILLDTVREKKPLHHRIQKTFKSIYYGYYKERNLDIIVKNNLFPTEEIGVFPHVHSSIYSPEFEKVTSKDNKTYYAFWNKEILDVKLSSNESTEGGLAKNKYNLQ